jgi:hypothetical protein
VNENPFLREGVLFLGLTGRGLKAFDRKDRKGSAQDAKPGVTDI